MVLSVRGAGSLVIASSILSASSHIDFIKCYRNQLNSNDVCSWADWNQLATHIDHISTMQRITPENVIIPMVWEPFCIFDDSAGEGSGWLSWCFIAHTTPKSHRFQEMLQKKQLIFNDFGTAADPKRSRIGQLQF